MALLLGYDIGSSSIKATLMEAESDRRVVNGTLRVTIPPGAGWEWARGPKATAQRKTRARDKLCRMVTDVRPYDPRLWADRMDFSGSPLGIAR